MKTRLDEIKKLHEEADSLFHSDSEQSQEKLRNILFELFREEHTDWLIEQTEAVIKIKTEFEKIRSSFEQINELLEVSRF